MTVLTALLIVVTPVVAYVACGLLVARHASRELFLVNVRYVRRKRYSAREYDDPLTDDELAWVFRKIRTDQRSIVALWPIYFTRSVVDWNRARRKARLGASGGWMLAGARAAAAELDAACTALEVWRDEAANDDATDLQREAARSMLRTTEDTIRKLEGRTW